jgi:hypothetical protein
VKERKEEIKTRKERRKKSGVKERRIEKKKNKEEKKERICINKLTKKKKRKKWKNQLFVFSPLVHPLLRVYGCYRSGPPHGGPEPLSIFNTDTFVLF